LDPSEIPTLVDQNGRFRENAFTFLSAYMKKKISMNEVERELHAQFEKVMQHGVSISHVDSHQHIHMLPKILEITIRLAEKFGVRHIRYPKEKIRLESIYSFGKYPRVVQQIALNLCCLYSRKRIRPYAGGNFHGFFHGGRMRKIVLQKILSAKEDGISEIMVHPALIKNKDSMETYRKWNYKWQEEYDGLIDPDILDLIKINKIKLATPDGACFSHKVAFSQSPPKKKLLVKGTGGEPYLATSSESNNPASSSPPA
jgi:predicted glycoside hydrolase/deacetylase ChbG (UPF0249 family)